MLSPLSESIDVSCHRNGKVTRYKEAGFGVRMGEIVAGTKIANGDKNSDGDSGSD